MGYKDIFKISAKTAIGQHFLTDKKILNLIAKQVPIDCQVLEIGAGPGQLTEILAKKVNRILAVEIDEQFLPVLTDLQEKYNSLELIIDNVLKIDFKQFNNFWLVGNLPYHITEPLIDKIIRTSILGAVFLVGNSFAKEAVALNLDDLKNFGKLSLTVYVFFEPEIVALVEKQKFNPKPRTDSAILILKPKNVEVYKKNRRLFVLRELFLSSHHGALVKNVLMNSFIDFNNQTMTKNEARKLISQLSLPDSILEKSFEQLNNQEYLVLYKNLN